MTSNKLTISILVVFGLAVCLASAQPVQADGTETISPPPPAPVGPSGPSGSRTTTPSNNTTTCKPSQGSSNSSSTAHPSGGKTAHPTNLQSAHPTGNAGSVSGMAAQGNTTTTVVPGDTGTGCGGPGNVVTVAPLVNWSRPKDPVSISTVTSEATPQEIVACQTKIGDAETAISQGNWAKGINEILAAQQIRGCDSQKNNIKAILEKIDAEALRRLNLAKSLADQGKYEEAIRGYQEIIILFPGRQAATAATTAIATLKADPKYSLAGVESKARAIEGQLDTLLAGAKTSTVQPTPQPAVQMPGQSTDRPVLTETGQGGGNAVNKRLLQLRSVPPATQVKALYLIEVLGSQYGQTDPGKRATTDLVEIKKDTKLYEAIVSNRDESTRQAKLNLARTYRKAELFEKAATLYSEIITNWPNSDEAKLAKDELTSMRAGKKLILTEARN